MCLLIVSVVVLGAADLAPLVSTVVGVDLGVWWTRHLLAVLGPRTPLLLLSGGVPLYVAEEDVSGFGLSPGEVVVLRLQHCRPRRPGPGVADVVEGEFDGVGC